MLTYYRRLMMCSWFVFAVACALVAQVTTNMAPPTPASLADAETAYQQEAKLVDNVSSYYAMALSFYRKGWTELSLEECDNILQRWPEDRSKALTDVLTLKSCTLTSLNRWPEAYTSLESFYQQHKNDRTILHTGDDNDGIPYNYYLQFFVLDTKALLLEREKKYHDAAIMLEQVVNLYHHPANDAEQTFIENHLSPSSLMYYNVEKQEKSADLFFQAGEYDIALTKYTAILTFLKMYFPTQNILPSLGLSLNDKAKYQLKYYYIIPVEIAICQMKEQHFADALRTYKEITRNIHGSSA